MAAGNDGSNASNYSPGNCSGVIAVGAVTNLGRLPAYSNTGGAVTLSAPGGTGLTPTTAVLTTFDSGTQAAANDSDYSALNGTSIAAAHVSGVASLMLSVNPTLLPNQVRFILRDNARAFPSDVVGGETNCNTSLCGAGIVDTAPSVLAARAFGQGSPQPAVTAGRYASYGLRDDGVVFDMGSPSAQRGEPVGVRRISAGTNLVVAALVDGTVRVWSDSGTSAPAAGIAGVMAVSSGTNAYHWLALRNDGTVWGQGSNTEGQLGDGTIADRSSPVQVPALSGVAGIAAGANFSLAVKHDGTVWGWGGNGYGQLGDGSNSQRLAPVQATGLANVVSVAAGNVHALAIRADGTVWAWGDNELGQLGDGTTASAIPPHRCRASRGRHRCRRAGDSSLALRKTARCGPGGTTPSASSATAPRPTATRPCRFPGSPTSSR